MSIRTTLVEPERSERRQLRPAVLLVCGVLVAAALLLVLAVLVNVAPAGRDAAAAHALSVAGGGRTAASLDLAGGAGSVRLRSADLGDDLLRASTPPGSARVPRARVDGDAVSLTTDKVGDGPDDADIEIVLNQRTRWELRLSGGARSAALDLRGAAVGQVDLATGVSTVEIWAPAPAGTLTVTEAGGAQEVTLHAPAGLPVRVAVTGGAGSLQVDGATRTGVSGETVLEPPGWAGASDRIDLRLIGGVARIRVDRG